MGIAGRETARLPPLTAWTYRLPPDIRVRVEARKKPGLLSDVLGEEMESEGEAALVLDVGARPFEPIRSPLSVAAGGRAIAVRGMRKAVPWSCSIEAREPEGWRIAFRSPMMREFLAWHVALIPALRLLLLDRGAALVGGAAFEMGGGATMLAGLPGSGKTALLLGALEQGARLIGDEYLGLTEGGEVLPAARVLALRQGTFALAPGRLERLSARRRSALRLAKRTAGLTRGRLQPLVHVPASEFDALPSGGEAVPVRRLIWLEASEAADGVSREPMERREAVEKLVLLKSLHDLAFGDIGVFINSTRPERASVQLTSRWWEIAERALRDVECVRLSVPAGRVLTPAVLEQVI